MPKRIPRRALKVPLPDTVQQTDYTCGASCLQAICAYYGVGPTKEEDYARIMRIQRDVGAHPHNILRGIREFGLRYEERWPMCAHDVREYLDRGIPVMLMLQAWATDEKRGGKRWKGYATEWNDGHWVAAIGYDNDLMYFEDPSLAGVRGYMSVRELGARWHDVGPYWIKPYERYMYNYGVAIWKRGARHPDDVSRASHID
jgi:uncharacterized protein